eukprot:ANDGO_01720.mRNA.1 hypothetical protein
MTTEQVPFLESLSATSWKSFCLGFQAYKARGGNRKALDLMAPRVIAVLKVRSEKVVTLEEGELFKVASSFFALW